jgi:hypothetical protein
MFRPNVLATALASGALVVSGMAVPAYGDTAGADAKAPEPLTVVSLTDLAGVRTDVAVAGLEELTERATADSAAEGMQTMYSSTFTGGGAGIGRPAPAARLAATQTAPELENIAVLTLPMATEEFMVAGLTWESGESLPSGGRVFLRVLEDATWSEWLEVEEEDGADEAQGGRAGTDPFVTGGAEAVQIQVTGAAEELPAGLEVNLIPATPDAAAPEKVVTAPTDQPAELPKEEPTATTEPAAFISLGAPHGRVFTAAYTGGAAVAATAVANRPSEALTKTTAAAATFASSSGTSPTATIMPAAVTAPRPAITSRAGWGADETQMNWRRTYAPLKATVVHHTAGSNNYSWSQSASVVSGIYYYHSVTRGWGDIGYNFLVDKWGRVFEGRSGSLAAPQGQMVVGGHAQPFNNGTLGISAMGTFVSSASPSRSPILDSMANVIAWQYARAGIDMTSPSGLISNGSPTRPAGQNLARIFGHKDVSNTTCPGLFYGDLGALSRTVHLKMPQLFYLNNSFSEKADISFRYGERGADVFVGDWDRDGRDSIATRMDRWFSVNNKNEYGEADTVFAYGKPGDLVLVGDWNGDGVDTLAVRRGREYHVKNSISSGVADRVIYYGRPDDEVVVGDWDGDGVDTLAVRRGREYHVKNSISSGVADQVISYGKPSDAVYVGDWDGDGSDSFTVRRGSTYHIKHSVSTGVADRVVIFGRVDDLTLVGDWDGDGDDTLGVRRP